MLHVFLPPPHPAQVLPDRFVYFFYFEVFRRTEFMLSLFALFHFQRFFITQAKFLSLSFLGFNPTNPLSFSFSCFKQDNSLCCYTFLFNSILRKTRLFSGCFSRCPFVRIWDKVFHLTAVEVTSPTWRILLNHTGKWTPLQTLPELKVGPKKTSTIMPNYMKNMQDI